MWGQAYQVMDETGRTSEKPPELTWCGNVVVLYGTLGQGTAGGVENDGLMPMSIGTCIQSSFCPHGLLYRYSRWR